MQVMMNGEAPHRRPLLHRLCAAEPRIRRDPKEVTVGSPQALPPRWTIKRRIRSTARMFPMTGTNAVPADASHSRSPVTLPIITVWAHLRIEVPTVNYPRAKRSLNRARYRMDPNTRADGSTESGTMDSGIWSAPGGRPKR